MPELAQTVTARQFGGSLIVASVLLVGLVVGAGCRTVGNGGAGGLRCGRVAPTQSQQRFVADGRLFVGQQRRYDWSVVKHLTLYTAVARPAIGPSRKPADPPQRGKAGGLEQGP